MGLKPEKPFNKEMSPQTEHVKSANTSIKPRLKIVINSSHLVIWRGAVRTMQEYRASTSQVLRSLITLSDPQPLIHNITTGVVLQ